jgi:hypothetical protein
MMRRIADFAYDWGRAPISAKRPTAAGIRAHAVTKLRALAAREIRYRSFGAAHD